MRSARVRGLAAAVACAGLAVGAASAVAAVQGSADAVARLVLIGRDDDVTTDTTIQPPGVAANQSLRKADILVGGAGPDVLIGREGSDTILGGDGNDVMVGGTERGSDLAAFGNSDIALGGDGNDIFIWAPGDGSDAFVGGEPPATTLVRRVVTVRRNGRTVRVVRLVRAPSPPDNDVLVLGTLALQPGDNFQPALTAGRFGPLPTVNVSGVNLPATIGTNPPAAPIRGFCEIVRAPEASGYHFLVRFFVEATGVQAVTIRTRNVERVLCRTRGSDTITSTFLGAAGTTDPVARGGFQPPAGGKLDALID